MKIQQENYWDVLGDIKPLLIKHWEDIALDKDAVKLDPSWEMYDYLANHGNIHVTTVRNDDGVMVGYCVYILSRAMHYATETYADGDIFWLDPDYRKGTIGIRMLKAAEKSLATLGVTKVLNKVKLHKDVGKIFEHLGYSAIERVYAKRIA
tara:strand:+ start:686 stop:1138 length:453 start_codon:yes stop_codon:yes gene_type:complete